MSVTIAQIVDTAYLRTRYLAGVRGGTRRVVWAHTCELPDPWSWLGEDELLLADGYNFPGSASGQVEFIEQLATARLAGLALAAGMHAAPLTSEGARAADALAFPVLETEYEVPFVAIARAVAERNSKASVASLTKILSVYDRLHRTDPNPARQGLLEQLEMEAGAHLNVIDLASGQGLLPSRTPLPAPLAQTIIEEMRARQGPLPGYARVVVGAERVLVVPFAGAGAALVAEPLAASDTVDLVLLQHIATIAGLEITRRAQDSEASRAASAQLFTQMLDGSLTSEGAEARLELVGFRSRDRRVIAIRSSGRAHAIHARLYRDGIRHLLMTHGGQDLILSDAAEAVLDCVEGEHAGISLPALNAARVPDAVREARWALEAATSSGAAALTYGDYSAPFLPRTPEEARLVVDRVLGPVIAYDQSENADLLATLEAFFEADRSWQITAQRLGVHKQTVVYRIRRIEDLTGRTLRRVGDQTELFLALEARKLLGI